MVPPHFPTADHTHHVCDLICEYDLNIIWSKCSTQHTAAVKLDSHTEIPDNTVHMYLHIYLFWGELVIWSLRPCCHGNGRFDQCVSRQAWPGWSAARIFKMVEAKVWYRWYRVTARLPASYETNMNCSALIDTCFAKEQSRECSWMRLPVKDSLCASGSAATGPTRCCTDPTSRAAPQQRANSTSLPAEETNIISQVSEACQQVRAVI